MSSPGPSIGDARDGGSGSVYKTSEAATALMNAIFAQDVIQVEALLMRDATLAKAFVTHYHKPCQDDDGRDEYTSRPRMEPDTPRPRTEPVIIFAGRVPLYLRRPRQTGSRAASTQILAIAQLLVDSGGSLCAIPDAAYWSERALIDVCADYDSPEMMHLLLRAGAKMPRSTEVWSRTGGFLEHGRMTGGIGYIAGWNGHVGTVQALFGLGFQFTAFERGRLDYPLALLSSCELRPGGGTCMSALAITYGHRDVVALLLRQLGQAELRRTLTPGEWPWNPTVIDAWLVCAVAKAWSRGETEAWAWEKPQLLAQSEEIVHLLLDHGANPAVEQEFGNSLLFCACRWAGSSVIERLIVATAVDVNARRAHIDIFEGPRGGRQVTALQLAATHHNLGAVKSLVALGASAQLTDENGRNALHWALIGRKRHVVPEVRRSGTDGCEAAVVWSRPLDIMAELLPGVTDVSAADGFGRTALHYAAKSFLWEAMGVLIRSGADGSLRDSDGCTAAFYMARTAPLWWMVKAIRDSFHNDINLSDGYLLGLRALGQQLQDSQAPMGLDLRCLSGQTALTAACREANVPMVEMLLSLGAQVDITDDEGRTALHHVVISAYEVGPLYWEAEARAEEMKRLLRDAGIDESIRDHAGKTAADVQSALEAKCRPNGRRNRRQYEPRRSRSHYEF
ncbi:ankyrin repeat protein [Purpureocillium lilacinum]|uniref:Ankyrin repeat protein n=1 Tax=Purpureocillium lilacinum TaxID=33203 RepID=A0A2U3EB25_PURLI|nr:ankyrin repeat protein [Purpureocillium lilacinum]